MHVPKYRKTVVFNFCRTPREGGADTAKTAGDGVLSVVGTEADGQQ
jgi:hypothetical protein